jgi:hypothetical protein
MRISWSEDGNEAAMQMDNAWRKCEIYTQTCYQSMDHVNVCGNFDNSCKKKRTNFSLFLDDTDHDAFHVIFNVVKFRHDLLQ